MTRRNRNTHFANKNCSIFEAVALSLGTDQNHLVTTTASETELSTSEALLICLGQLSYTTSADRTEGGPIKISLGQNVQQKLYVLRKLRTWPFKQECQKTSRKEFMKCELSTRDSPCHSNLIVRQANKHDQRWSRHHSTIFMLEFQIIRSRWARPGKNPVETKVEYHIDEDSSAAVGRIYWSLKQARKYAAPASG